MRNHLKRYSGSNLPARPNQSPYPTARLSSPISLVDTAREIERAHQSIARQTHAQLRLIADQIRHLQEQARSIIEQAEDDLDLHRIPCSFRRVPGQSYHLYQRGDRRYFSMLSPADHGGRPPHDYLGTYRLDADDSWTLLVDRDGNPQDEGEAEEFTSG